MQRCGHPGKQGAAIVYSYNHVYYEYVGSYTEYVGSYSDAPPSGWRPLLQSDDFLGLEDFLGRLVVHTQQ